MKTLKEIRKDKEWNISDNWLPPELVKFKEVVVNVNGRCVMRCGLCGKSPLHRDDYYYYGVDGTPICSKCWEEVILP